MMTVMAIVLGGVPIMWSHGASRIRLRARGLIDAIVEDDYLLDSLLIATTSRTSTKTPITVQSHIPPPAHPPIHPPYWFIIWSLLVKLRPAYHRTTRA